MVGTPYAGRAQEEVQQLAGCLVNTVALRTDISGNPSFRELLQRAARSSTAAFSHANAPFPRVVDTLRTDRSAAFTPVYQVGDVNSGSINLFSAETSAIADHCLLV